MALKWIAKLKLKWGITSDWDFFLICLVFSLAGMMVSVCRRPVFHLLGIERATPLWIKTLVYIPVIIPIYQLSLILFSFPLGQFSFFWSKQKRLGRFILRAFQRPSS